jgi:prepilin-type processing-associated H-X9-DG protein
MKRALLFVAAGLALVLVLGLFFPLVGTMRVTSDRKRCENHLRELGFMGLHEASGPIPPGTVPNPKLAVDERLSWLVDVLPIIPHPNPAVPAALERIDRKAAWDAGANAAAAQQRIAVLLCPALVPDVPEGQPAVTQYVGIGGVGPDAATFGVVERRVFDPKLKVERLEYDVPPGAGAFRYDQPTPRGAFLDGQAETILIAETNLNLGPWLRGGPSTVRTLDVGPDAPKPVGVGGQFGGMHPGGMNACFADGHVSFIADTISPSVLRLLFTLADPAGAADELP